MLDFTISIAGIAIRIHALHEFSKKFYAGYLTDDPPEMVIVSCQENVEREKQLSEDQAIRDGKTPMQHTTFFWERLAIYREIAERFLDRNILLFHGSAIAVDGETYLFTAKSGTGKSTHTRLWREMLGDRALMVNDDKPMLKITPEGCLVCGTPWNGKHQLGNNVMLPLKAVCVLERAETNDIQLLETWDAFSLLYPQCFQPMDQSRRPKVMELLNGVIDHTLLYRMHCNNLEATAARVSFERMSRDKKERKGSIC